jgi:(2Fe-2S) ferredoxin
VKPFEKHVFVCTNRRPPGDPKGSCADKGADEVRERFRDLLSARGLKGKVRANAAGCLDVCAQGCTVVVYPDTVWYGRVKPEDVEEIVEQHIVGGEPVARLRIDRS